LPPYINQTSSIDEVIEFIYGNDINQLTSIELSERAILAPLNSDVRAINKMILSKCKGHIEAFLSYDEELDTDGEIVHDLPVEIRHDINRSSLPLHHLQLKKGSVVMCLRNMSRKVCNGTKLIVEKLNKHIIDCKIMTGPGKNESISIPQITLIDNSLEDTIIIKRRQFPISLAYAMTIDKSQGQSLCFAGIVLNTQCFAHGQLYTALSRPTIPEHIIVCTPQLETILDYPYIATNIVWKEIFNEVYK
jgi:ATP-dependent DNA helicase PIF1